MLIRNIPVGIIKKSKTPNKLTVTFKHEDSATGYACSAFPKDDFIKAYRRDDMYNLNIDDDKKVCVSYKNNDGNWRNNWMSAYSFKTLFDKSRQAKAKQEERERPYADDGPLPGGDDLDNDFLF